MASDRWLWPYLTFNYQIFLYVPHNLPSSHFNTVILAFPYKSIIFLFVPWFRLFFLLPKFRIKQETDFLELRLRTKSYAYATISVIRGAYILTYVFSPHFSIVAIHRTFVNLASISVPSWQLSNTLTPKNTMLCILSNYTHFIIVNF